MSFVKLETNKKKIASAPYTAHETGARKRMSCTLGTVPAAVTG